MACTKFAGDTMKCYVVSRCARRYTPIKHGLTLRCWVMLETLMLLIRTCPLLCFGVMRMPTRVRRLLSMSPAPGMPSTLAVACILLLLRGCCHLPLLRLPPLTTRVHLPSATYVVPLAFTVRKASAL